MLSFTHSQGKRYSNFDASAEKGRLPSRMYSQWETKAQPGLQQDITPPVVMHRGWYLSYCTQCITKVPDGVSKPCLLSIYRLNLDPHPPVHFAGPEGPGKMHWGVGVKVEAISTKTAGIGPYPWYPTQCTECNTLGTTPQCILRGWGSALYYA